ncbi:MAG TPA: septum formation inhibitor Maf [Proteus sp.]|uniref:7-methyl-GTP pyrophosphatase n=1 Tax=Proteus hauseri ATCC 700826 TaxID=1354271 RepID=A0AAJ3HSY7_PROHU|nr:nucleoside triphosphate pyrophosphatase [Proteus hauseri]OAT47095.1 Maf/YceF/YhdE family protein [Proteus hauseri ATCC 700826]HCH49793.1 septum formation inhibitor Maf [Proteus sp. (in: enterobacteria)]
MLPLILASTSPFRAQLLKKLGIPFIQASPEVDETPKPTECAQDLVTRLSYEKASALQVKFPHHLIIGSDQVCVLNKNITGKPLNFDNAFTQLKQASGQCVSFYTGLTLYNSLTLQHQTHCELFQVYFRCLTDDEIIGYLNKEMPFYCAGSFKSEGLGITLFDKLVGDDPNSLIGLPLIQLNKMLLSQGINPLLFTDNQK